MLRRVRGSGLIACATAGCVLLVAGLAIARDLGTKIDQDSAHGRHAVAGAHGAVAHPQALFARVRTHPKQRFHGDFDVICRRGANRAERAGRWSARAPDVKRLPHAFDHPDTCSAGVAAQLRHRGRIIVQLWAR